MTSKGSVRTRPPACRAFAAASSALWTQMYVFQTAWEAPSGADATAATSPPRWRAWRRAVLESPAEATAIEGDGGLWIGLTGVDPAGYSGCVSVSLGHWRSLSRWFECPRTLRAF